MTRTIPFVLGLAGLALVTLIVGWLGAGHVMRALLSVGLAGFAGVIGVQLGLYLVLAWAWHVVWPSIPWPRLLLGRTVREAGTTCLPFSHVGGIALGIKAISGPGADLAQAFAACVADVTIETVSQIAFIACGLAALDATSGDRRFTPPLLAGLALMAACLALFIWLQKDGAPLLRRLFAGLGRRVAKQWRNVASHGIDEIQDGLEQVYDRKQRLAFASALHFAAWLGGAFWTWFVYGRLQAPITPAQALAVEGVVSGLLTLSFLIPGNLGVQEAAYVAIGSLFGIDADLSLGVSLLRRAKDLAIGVPVLLLWQAIELRRAGVVIHAARPIE